MTCLVLALMLTAAGPPAAARLDSVLAEQGRAGFSGAVLVRQDGIEYARAASAAARLGVAPDRLAFWLASDSKQFTATAILRLEEMGRLRVTDSLPRFFDRVPADKRGITIHQLLTHTSGLPTAYRAEGIADRDSAVSATLGLKLLAAPGERYSYSNDGYTLLAAIVEVASGTSFETFLVDSLFARAGLVETGLWGFEDPRVTIAPLADPARARRQRATIYRDGHSVANWGYRGPGGAYSTPRDVARWIDALRSGRVLGPAAFRKLVGRHVLVREDSTGQSYAGYGWGVRVEGGNDVSYGHVGSDDWLGHNAVIRFSPSGEVVVVLSNAGEVRGDPWAARVNREIRRVMDPPRPGR